MNPCKAKDLLYLYFDCECRQDVKMLRRISTRRRRQCANCNTSWCRLYRQEPYLCVARRLFAWHQVLQWGQKKLAKGHKSWNLMKSTKRQLRLSGRCVKNYRSSHEAVVSSSGSSSWIWQWQMGEKGMCVDSFQWSLTLASASSQNRKALDSFNLMVIALKTNILWKRKWLMYVSKTPNSHIQYALNSGEKKIGPSEVDGIMETCTCRNVLGIPINFLAWMFTMLQTAVYLVTALLV